MSLVEIYRSATPAGCEQQALVLRAMGIRCDIVFQGDAFVLLVAPEDTAAAHRQLAHYLAENVAAAPEPIRPPPMHRFAWVACTLYVCLLIVPGFLAGRYAFGFDWYAVGALSSAMIAHQEWWRAMTALTLHVDHGHLLTNIGFGVLFSYPAARLVGSGVALTGMMLAATFGNVFDALLMPSTHVAIGASTIVFAALGLISAYSWRLQFSRRLRWAHRWAPLVIGTALLGLIGSSGENTDVLGHLTGFFCGVGAGVLLARIPAQNFSKPRVQIASAVATCMLCALAWTWGGLAR
jgi:rhomboid protease GluP